MPKLPVSEEQYKIIFEKSAAAIMLADAQKRILSWNSFAEKLLGMSSDDLNMRSLETLYPPEEWIRMQGMGITERGVQEHFETKMIKKNGQVTDVDISITVLKDPEGRVTGSIGIIRDISERKISEREILNAHHMKGDFLAMVSHELRTPLTAIKGSIGIIMDGSAGAVNDEQKDFLQTAMRNVDRLEMQLNNVMDYQRLEAGAIEFKFTPEDMNMVATTIKTEFDAQAAKKGLEIKLELAPDLPKVKADKERMKRALRNLMDNAIKFTSKGEITLMSSIELGKLNLSVKDTGVGIKEEDRKKLFEKFSQVSSGHGRQTGSLGLGLVTARKIVSAHRGDIWIDSEPGKGSVFSIVLPLD